MKRASNEKRKAKKQQPQALKAGGVACENGWRALCEKRKWQKKKKKAAIEMWRRKPKIGEESEAYLPASEEEARSWRK